MSSKFYYFGFGSNMLLKRIQLQNPTAKRIGPGKLKNYRLDFHTSSTNWLGAPATIVPTPEAIVLGAIWQIDTSELEHLDKQEGVDKGIYTPIMVPVVGLHTGDVLECRAYLLINQPENDLRAISPEVLPHNRQPSKTYLKVIVQGAIETGLSKEYIAWLQSIKHNGATVDKMELALSLTGVNLLHN